MEENKESFKPKFKSEFSMGELDFRRFDIWLGRAELSSSVIDSCEIPSIEIVQRYFAELNVLYKSWKPLISSISIRVKLNELKSSAKKKKRIWENSLKSGIEFNKFAIFELVDLLDEFHEELLSIKQIIGLGIVVKKIISTKERIKYGLNPKRDLANLPEA